VGIPAGVQEQGGGVAGARVQLHVHAPDVGRSALPPR
jgi:hypothetical protein